MVKKNGFIVLYKKIILHTNIIVIQSIIEAKKAYLIGMYDGSKIKNILNLIKSSTISKYFLNNKYLYLKLLLKNIF